MESVNAQESLQKEAREEVYPNINFQPGIHSLKPLINIDTPSGWNEETIARLQKSKPKFITLDGPSALPQNTEDNPLSAWFSLNYLELHPEEINPHYDKMYFIRGDVPTFSNPLHYLATNESQHRSIDKVNEKKFSKSEVTQLKNVVKDAVFTSNTIKLDLAALVFLTARAVLSKNKNEKPEDSNPPKDPPNLTRRKFLKLGLAAIGGTLVAPSIPDAIGSLLTFNASKKTDNDSIKMIGELANKLEIIPSDNWWVDGRTALLIAKTQDAIKITGEPSDAKAEIVMGTAHFKKGQEFLQDTRTRDKAIHAFAFNVIKECKPLFTELHLSDVQTNDAINMLLDNIAYSSIVTAEGNKPSQIPTVTPFFSSQVLDATKDLRQI